MKGEESAEASAPSTETSSSTGQVYPRTFSSRKSEEKHRKKDPKSWENISKTLNGMDDVAKISYLEKQYQDLYQQFRVTQQSYQNALKQNAVICKERDHNQSELAKSIMTRSRLENLCRELQKQNKQIKEENMAKIKEEEELRKEVSSKFADKLTDINNMMDENKERSDKLREENLKMTAKLAELYNQFQKREDDIGKMSKQLELERQYNRAALQKLELEIQAEKEINAKEQAILKNNLEKSEANCSVLMETVKGLQDHIDVYKRQYEDFESTMSKTAKVFGNFKSEISTMNKQVSSSKQETQSWKSKYQDSMKALVEMSEIKQNQEMYVNAIDRKNDQLHKLCRQLQTERAHYLKLLKENNIEPSPPPKENNVVEQPPPARLTTSPKMTKKEKELQLLKKNLKAVQDTLNRINIEEQEKADAEKTDEASQDCAKIGQLEEIEAVQPTSETDVQPTCSKTIEPQILNLPQ